MAWKRQMEPDSSGRYPLTGREWNAIRCIQCALNEVEVCQNVLKDRLKLSKDGWRFLRIALSLLEKVCDLLYETIPAKKLAAMREEIRHSQIRLCVKGADNQMPPGVVYMDEKSFIRIMNRLIDLECWSCEKTGKAVRQCEILECITDVLHYESDPAELPKDGRCELAGCSSVLKEEK